MSELRVLVVNCGSTSIKYRVYLASGKALHEELRGLIERIGEKGGKVRTHEEGIKVMLKEISKKGIDIDTISVVGHRVVHGGEIAESKKIDKRLLKQIEKYVELAPLHNPVNLAGIRGAMKHLPKAVNVAVFDTAFHQTLPEYAYCYAIPYEYVKEGIRRYGFHGTSHKYVAERCAFLLGKRFERLNAITCHLGAGCSITAIAKGKSIDTSMGLTPLEGLMMATRCGDIDAGILIHLLRKGMDADSLDKMLNKKSGLLGISGVGKDMRLILKCMKQKKRCRLAFDMFCYRVRRYISAYLGILEKTDAIVFTAGIGENVPLVRKRSSHLPQFGVLIDDRKNARVIGKEGMISKNNSKVKVFVIPTDEEKMIAIESLRILGVRLMG